MRENEKMDFGLNPDQKKYLNSLVCQRLSADEENREILKNFVNETHPGVSEPLRKGWNADKKGKLAIYIVKDSELDVPMFLFSLRCGELHIPLDPEKFSKSVQSARMLLKEAERCSRRIHYLPGCDLMEQVQIIARSKELLRAAREVEVEDWAQEVIEKQLVDGNLSDDAWEKLWIRLLRSMGKERNYLTETKMEGDNIIRTKNSFAAVELVHFCAYDPVKWHELPPYLSKAARKKIKMEQNCVAKKWHDKGMDNQHMGHVFFWKFVLPAIQEIKKHVGCEYIYLFAADDKGNREGPLVQYYQKLGFNFRNDFKVTKPVYDFCCYFMCQEVTGLRNQRNAFFRDYNKPKEPEKTEEPAKV